MTPEEADHLLAQATRVPYAKTSLADGRVFVAHLLAAGIPAAVHRPDESCRSGKCGPSYEVLVREEDVPRVVALQRERWHEALAREGLAPVAPRLADGAPADGAQDEPPCPACGLAAPLLNGACTDCGLQLE